MSLGERSILTISPYVIFPFFFFFFACRVSTFLFPSVQHRSVRVLLSYYSTKEIMTDERGLWIIFFKLGLLS